MKKLETIFKRQKCIFGNRYGNYKIIAGFTFFENCLI